MSGKSKKSPKRPVGKVDPATKAQPKGAAGYGIWLLKNIFAGLIIYVLVFQCIQKQPGYNWAYNSLMKGNYKVIRENRKLTPDQRLEAKIGINYAYWKFLKENTPEDAVILYPTTQIFFPKDQKSHFTGEPANKTMAARFLHPRILVYPTETETSRFGKQITHVAIVNGWGYDYLEYEVSNRSEIAVLPLKKPGNNP